MKALLSISMKKSIGLALLVGFFFTILGTTSIQAQEQAQKTVKGVISNELGPLESVSIILKGTNTGTATNEKGEFTFPKLLSVGDILIISYIGYDKIEVPIKASTTTLDIVLTEDLIEFVGAPSSEKPYKSKRNKRNKQKGK